MIKNCPPEKAIIHIGLVALMFFCAGVAAPAWAQEAAATPAASEAPASWFDKVAHTTNLLLPAALGVLAYYLLHTRRKKELHGEIPVLVGADDEAKADTSQLEGEVGPTRASAGEESVIGVAPSFYFALEGEGAHGDMVRYGADVELIFDYAILTPLALMEVKSKRLETTVKKEERVELGITVIPVGFKLRDGVWFRIAEFRRGALAKPVRFPLTASQTPVSDAHLFITLSLYGCVLYQFPVRVRLVNSLPDEPVVEKSVKTLDLDLDEVVAENEFATRPGGARP